MSTITTVQRAVADHFDLNTLDINVQLDTLRNVERVFVTLPPFTDLARLKKLETNLQSWLGSSAVSYVGVTGKDTIAFDISYPFDPNKHEITNWEALFGEANNFVWNVGTTFNGKPVEISITKAPHILISGVTGSGKSIALQALISDIVWNSLLGTYQIALLDKKADMTIFESMPCVRNQKVSMTDTDIQDTLCELATEVEFRYRVFQEDNTRDINTYNESVAESVDDQMEFVFIVIDELADVLGSPDSPNAKYLTTIAQMGRACGIHIIAATQRPSATVIPTQLRSQFPVRVCYRVMSKADSRMILGQGGAEHLTGSGDGLILAPQYTAPVRFISPYVPQETLKQTIDMVKEAHLDLYTDN